MAFRTPWDDLRPFPGVSQLPANKITRITVELPREVAVRLTQVTLASHILTAICQTALHDAYLHAERNNLQYADFPRFLDDLRKRAHCQPSPEAAERNVGVGTAGVRTAVTPAGTESAESREGVKKGGGGEGAEGKGKTGKGRK